MYLAITIKCDTCGKELQVTDTQAKYTADVHLKVQPCATKGCGYPENCIETCEDIEEKEKELIAFRDQVAELEKTVIERDAELLDLKQKIGVIEKGMSTREINKFQKNTQDLRHRH